MVMERLKDNDRYFTNLIDLIPPKLYFDDNEEIIEMIELNKKIKFIDDSDGLSKKTMHKKAKLDPSLRKTVTEIAREYDEEEKGIKRKGKRKGNAPQTKIEILKNKLNEKIKQLKESRGGMRHKHEKKIKREPKDERRKNNRNVRVKNREKGMKTDKSNSKSNDKRSNGMGKKIEKNTHSGGGESKLNNDKMPKIYNSEGNLVFSKFDFIPPLVEDTKDGKKKHKKMKSLKKKLIETRKDQQKIEHLKSIDSEAAQKLVEKKNWRSAIDRSEGIKVKDNPQLIEKTLKRKDKMKKKSTKKWKERNEMVESKIKHKQNVRERNIKFRNTQKKQRKLNKMKKKGHIIKAK